MPLPPPDEYGRAEIDASADGREYRDPLGKADGAAAADSSKKQPVQYLPESDRPQPRKDADRERGMATSLGRLRPCPVFDWKFVALSHNTIRGAAGAAVLNAELMESEGLLD